MNEFKTPANYHDAVAIQNHLRTQVKLQDEYEQIKIIAGIDVGYDPNQNISKAAIVLMHLEDLTVFNSVIATEPTNFPYIPGLLSFREVPVLLKALSQISQKPDILFVDGQGIAHPRRLGIASHIGVLSGYPAIGIAKSVLCGRYQEPGLDKGHTTLLIDKTEVIGTVLRSKNKTKPLFISAGHKISQESALKLVLQCLTHYRLPEPTRLADKLSKFAKTQPAQLF